MEDDLEEEKTEDFKKNEIKDDLLLMLSETGSSLPTGRVAAEAVQEEEVQQFQQQQFQQQFQEQFQQQFQQQLQQQFQQQQQLQSKKFSSSNKQFEQLEG